MNEAERPWGHYKVLHREPGVQVKRIEVKPGLRFSLQTHKHRGENWIVTSGTGIATVGTKDIPVRKGSYIEIGAGVAHRLANTGKTLLAIIEVQFGDYLEEDDIIRLQDDFGR